MVAVALADEGVPLARDCTSHKISSGDLRERFHAAKDLGNPRSS
jgi:hypothetical protein